MDTTIDKLRAIWRSVIESGGGHCAVCDRWGKVYGRPINRTMARSLIWLCHAEADKDGWVDVPKVAPRWVVQSNQLPTMRWWELVERRGNEGKTKTKHSGLWRPTPQGLDFVHMGTRVPKQVFTYNDTVQGYGLEMVTIVDCFEDNFDYSATMSTLVPANMTRV
jgi:hypothetical protein